MINNVTRRSFMAAGGMTAFALAACDVTREDASAGQDSEAAASGSATVPAAESEPEAEPEAAPEPLGENPADMAAVTIDMDAWNYDADNDTWYQIGVAYCATPAATAYETMGIYVPGPYLTGTANADGTYSCAVNAQGAQGSFTAGTAPFVMPINTAGYSAQAAPTSYSYKSVSTYLEAGLIYVYAGCRGRDNGTNDDGTAFAGGAPWGATDLKAAVRCLRYNAASLPGDASKVFTFGHSGGGAQSSLMGATGDSALYAPYLASIGAVFATDDGEAISDAVTGAMCWCPITSLDMADAAYEWQMGQFASANTRADGTFTRQLSYDLAAAFGPYINGIGLVSPDGTALELEDGGEGVMCSGSYYDYVLSEVERSLNNFLGDTEWPYTPGSGFMMDGGFGGGSGGPGAATLGQGQSGGSSSSSGTSYETAADYIASLNSDEEWVSYDEATNTATISGLGAFSTHCKSASKSVCAFDDLSLGQAENRVFGDADQNARHFDQTVADLLAENDATYAGLSGYDASYAGDYAADIATSDSLGIEQTVRQDMYNPMYYACAAYEGFGSSTLAPHWRIRTGIEQGDTASTVEINLALALEAAGAGVDFETVWGQGHTTAERTGSSAANFIAWVEECC